MFVRIQALALALRPLAARAQGQVPHHHVVNLSRNAVPARCAFRGGSDPRTAMRLVLLALPVLLGGLQPSAHAQQAAVALAANESLPNAPGAEDASAVPSEPAEPASAGISGTVLDTNGSVIPGARVRLGGRAIAGERSVLSGDNGEFAFSKLPPGTYKLTVTAPGMGSYVSPEFPLAAGEQRLFSQVALSIAVASTDVRVFADREEMAQEQVRVALDQRVLGVLPNFYSSYDWHAPPMGAKQKFQLAFKSVSDPIAFLGAGVRAGAEQANNSYPGFGQGMKGYGKRYGAAYADSFTGRMMSSAIFPSLFRQDPRYFYKGSGSKASRAFYAISAAVICRGDNGRWQPNYSEVLGNFAAGGISNLYYPSGSRGLSLTLVDGLIETAGRSGNNLIREFVLRGLTPRVPNYHNGKQ